MGILFWRRVSRIGVSVAWPPIDAGTWVFEKHASLIVPELRPRPPRDLIPTATFATNQERDTPSRWGGDGSDGRSRTERKDRPGVDCDARRHRESGFQPGGERRVSGAGEPAVPGLLSGEAAVLHGRRRHLHAGRNAERRPEPVLRRQHAQHRQPDRRRQNHRQCRRADVRDADRGRRRGWAVERDRPIPASVETARSTSAVSNTA